MCDHLINAFLPNGLPGGARGKESACNAGDSGSIPGLERSPGEGNGNPLQCSCLQNPMDRGAWWATVPGVTESDPTEQLRNNNKWEEKRQEHVFSLPGSLDGVRVLPGSGKETVCDCAHVHTHTHTHTHTHSRLCAYFRSMCMKRTEHSVCCWGNCHSAEAGVSRHLSLTAD